MGSLGLPGVERWVLHISVIVCLHDVPTSRGDIERIDIVHAVGRFRNDDPLI
jgi:hypothetical protein